ncbi:MAG: S1 RNA-binding domain-containing protein [Myxococcota bacterium]|nr:S1 RNA-binding domain-containing protein [Myxococcota bacterium]
MSKRPREVTRQRKADRPAAKPVAARPQAPQREAQARGGQRRDRRQERPQAGPRPTGPKKELFDEDALAELANMDADAFAQAMGGVFTGKPQRFNNGDRIRGRVVGESERYWLLDIGDKAEAVLSKEERATAEIGEEIEAFVMGRDELGLRVGTKLVGAGAREHLEDAAESGIPLEGRVVARNAGGFTIEVAGQKAFCPVSHIDLAAGGDLDRFVGRSVTVKILEIRGRDVVVSARAWQEEQRAEVAEKQWATLREGDSLTGTVRRLANFGAFVDVGGIDGLLPRSEISWDRAAKVEELLSVGQQVEVRVLSIDPLAKKLSLSLKDPAAAPWTRVGTEFVVGQTYSGKVTRVTDFGAFVQLAPGLEGLVHISAMSSERVEHPSDVVKEGQKVNVTLLSADTEAKRLELSMKAGAQARGGKPRQASAGTQSLGTFADLFAAAKKR